MKTIISLLVVLLLLHLWAFLAVRKHTERFVNCDGYDDVAQSIYFNHHYARFPVPFPYSYHGSSFLKFTERNPEPESVHTPVYPLFIASVYSLFGYRPEMVIFVQILVRVFGAGLFFIAVKDSYLMKTMLLWGILMILDLSSFVCTYAFLGETLLCLLYVLLLLGWKRYTERPTSLNLMVVFFVAAGCVLAKPIASFCPLTFLLLALVSSGRLSLGKVGRMLLLFLFVTGLVILPYVFRNHRVFGAPALSATEGFNIFYGRAAKVFGAEMGIREQLMYEGLFEQKYRDVIESDAFRNLNSMQKSLVLGQKGLEYLKEHPFVAVKLHLQGVVLTLAPSFNCLFLLLTGKSQGTGIFAVAFFRAGHQHVTRWEILLVAAFFTVLLILVYAGMICGMVKAVRNKDKFVTGMMCLIFFTILIPGSSSFSSLDRFRVSVMPFIMFIAAYGFAEDSHTSARKQVIDMPLISNANGH